MNTGLSRMSVRLPRRMERVDDILARNGSSTTERRMFTKVYGLEQSPTLASDERMEDLLAEAGAAALGGAKPSLILYGHTLLTQEFAYRGGFANRLRERLGAPDAPMFGVSHVNCVSVLRSVELARRFLRSPRGAGAGPVLVLGGDHGSINDRSRFIRGMAVGGDAALAFTVSEGTASEGTVSKGTVSEGTVVAEDAGPAVRYRYLGAASGRDTRFHRNIRMSEAEFALFGQVCCERVIETAHRAAAAAGTRLEDVDWLMPHLSNAMFWRTFSGKSGFPKDRIRLDLLAEQGHTFGTDPLMALHRADGAGALRPGQRCALVSIGQGAYFQVTVVQIAEES